MTMTANVQSEMVATDSLLPFPNNPRIGDVGTIKESLRNLGQYRPIVAHRSTRRVLAGHHVWTAAKQLGWTEIAVTWVDGSEEFCRKVVLADNRTADLGSYNERLLRELLLYVPDLIATGYESIPMSADKEVTFTKPRPEHINPRKQVIVGRYRYKVDHDAWELWEERLLKQCGKNRDKAARQIGSRLGIEVASATKTPSKPVLSTNLTALDTQVMPIDSLTPYHLNAREGDIGAIMQSLASLGQYRPIIVNRRTREILVGNHTWRAAKELGWSDIAVAWVEVDEGTASKIVVVDNRSSDLATYNEAFLRQTLLSVNSLEGTGWDGDDLDDLIRGLQTRAKATRRLRLTVGQYRVPVEPQILSDWLDTLPKGKEREKIADLLDLPISDLPN